MLRFDIFMMGLEMGTEYIYKCFQTTINHKFSNALEIDRIVCCCSS